MAPEHRRAARPLLVVLLVAVAVDVLVALWDCRVLGDPRAALAGAVPCVPPAPRGGLVSAVVLAEQALVAAWPWALAAGSWRVFGVDYDRMMPAGREPLRRRALLFRAFVGGLRSSRFLFAWAIVVAVLVLGRPYGHPGADDAARVARAEVVKQLLLGSDLLAVAAGAAAVWRAWTPSARWGRSPVHAAVLVLLVTEAAVALIGPYVRDPYAEWDYARALYVLGFGAVAALVARGAGRPRPAP